MFNLNLMETIAADQQAERLHEAEMSRLLNTGRTNGRPGPKLAVMASGFGLIALMILQLVI